MAGCAGLVAAWGGAEGVACEPGSQTSAPSVEGVWVLSGGGRVVVRGGRVESERKKGGTATGLTGSLALDPVWYGAGGAPSCSAPRPPLRPARVRPFCREGTRLWCARAVLRTNERTNERTFIPCTCHTATTCNAAW